MTEYKDPFSQSCFDLAFSFLDDAPFVKATDELCRDHVLNTHAAELAREIQKCIDDYIANPGEIVIVGKLYRPDIPDSKPVPPPPDLKLV